MRILYHHRTQAEDAQGVHICEMVKAFRHLGHEVEIVALVKPGEDPVKKPRKNLRKWIFRRVPHWFYEMMAFSYNLYGYWCLRHAIKLKKPDLMYERYALNTFCGIWASRHFGIPLVLEVNAPLCYERSRFGKLAFKSIARFSERWICSHATMTLVVSNVIKQVLIGEGVPHHRLVVMPNGIDPKRFHPGVCGKAVRRKFGLDDNLVLGFVGWFRPWHGLKLLLEMMHETNIADRGVRLLLVGDGPAFSDLRSYAEQHNLLSAVKFTGPVKQEEVPQYIAAMDITVQPSAPEYASPMKIFEYMAMGKCVVAPDQANIREILEDRVSGFLFQAGSKEGLKSILLELIKNPTDRTNCGRNACRRVYESQFLWEANAQKTLALVFGGELHHASLVPMVEPALDK